MSELLGERKSCIESQQSCLKRRLIDGLSEASAQLVSCKTNSHMNSPK